MVRVEKSYLDPTTSSWSYSLCIHQMSFLFHCVLFLRNDIVIVSLSEFQDAQALSKRDDFFYISGAVVPRCSLL